MTWSCLAVVLVSVLISPALGLGLGLGLGLVLAWSWSWSRPHKSRDCLGLGLGLDPPRSWSCLGLDFCGLATTLLSGACFLVFVFCMVWRCLLCFCNCLAVNHFPERNNKVNLELEPLIIKYVQRLNIWSMSSLCHVHYPSNPAKILKCVKINTLMK